MDAKKTIGSEVSFHEHATSNQKNKKMDAKKTMGSKVSFYEHATSYKKNGCEKNDGFKSFFLRTRNLS